MAKATKTTVINDSALVAAEFATFGKFNINDAARAAMVRNIKDVAKFEEIRMASCAAWLIANKGFASDVALAIVDKAKMRGFNSVIGTLPKRDAVQEQAYVQVKGAWSYFLKVYDVETLNKPKVTKRAPQMAGTKASPKVDVNAPDAAKVAVEAIKITKAPAIDGAVTQAAVIIAALAKVGNVNAAILTGSKGAALRALISSNNAEIKRIVAMKD